MLEFLQVLRGRRAAMPDDFRHALDREVLITDRLRVKALLISFGAMVSLFVAMFFFDRGAVSHVWGSNFHIAYIFAVIIPFFAFEGFVLTTLSRHIARGEDLAIWRRFISAFIEASFPSLLLIIHIQSMGRAAALGFVAPMAYFLFIVLSTLRLDFRISAFMGAVAAVELFLIAMFYGLGPNDPPPDPVFHIARSFILVVGGCLAGAVGAQLRRQFESTIAAATARDRVTSLFGQHVSPQVVERLLTRDADGGKEPRSVAVMFVDFRDFTAAARVRAPYEVVERLDQAFGVLVDILDRHAGIVNKFLGDGFLALFGAPIADPGAAEQAVTAAHEMLEAIAKQNVGNDWPLRMGIGIHIGNVIAGNIGSPRRKEYTVIGDTVNFAARLEALNKEFGSQLLVSSAVRDALGPERDGAVLLGDVRVRGYDQPMQVWRLV